MCARAALGLLSGAVASYALLGYALWPVGTLVHPDMRAGFEAHASGIRLHAFFAATALLLGPLQFVRRLRLRRPALHRRIGKLYLVLGVGLGGVTGLYVSAFAYGGGMARAGFATLALAWLYTGMRGYLAIRSRAIEAHRRWMLRSYALALAAVTLRIYVGIGVAAGASFTTIYPWIAWLCWMPNLILAERWLRRSRSATPAAYADRGLGEGSL